jgi:hypothetical protein
METKTLKLNDYGMYLADSMRKLHYENAPEQFVPSPPFNIRMGYEETEQQYTLDDDYRPTSAIYLREGTDNTPTPESINPHTQVITSYYTFNVELICDVELTADLKEWLEHTEKWGVPTVYYG